MKKIISAVLTMAVILTGMTCAAEEVDLEVVHRIKDQAFNHSKVMDYMHVLADENGPRVSGSPGYRQAAEIAVAKFKEAGIDNADLESWGVFGRGWSWSRIAVQMKSPQVTTLTAFPADWSAATDGAVSGEVMFAPLWDPGTKPVVSDFEKSAWQIEAYKEKYRGKLRGKIVMIDTPVLFNLPEEPYPYRLDDELTTEKNKANEPGVKPPLEWHVHRHPGET